MGNWGSPPWRDTKYSEFSYWAEWRLGIQHQAAVRGGCCWSARGKCVQLAHYNFLDVIQSYPSPLKLSDKG